MQVRPAGRMGDRQDLTEDILVTAQDPRIPVPPKAEKPVFVPRWLQRARDGALYGYDIDGKPVAGKIMGGAR